MSLTSKPHLRQQNSLPVDFMDDEIKSGLDLVLQDDPQPTRLLLPMKAGETLLFSSHTWHRSSANKQLQANRVAYIQTWVHPRAAWRPDLVPWHPVNEHLKNAGMLPGCDLSGPRHPRTGGTSIPFGGARYLQSNYARASSSLKTATKQAGSSISMFDASDVVSTQIHNIIALQGMDAFLAGKSGSLLDRLRDTSCRDWLVKITCDTFYQSSETSVLELHTELIKDSGCQKLAELLSWTLKQILISMAAYECDRSRNVFNSAYAAWWKLAGASWRQRFYSGSFSPEYQLCRTDVSEFLKRIHVVREDYPRTTDGQLLLLETIVRGCMEYVPFQNVTMLTRVGDGIDHRPPTLGQIIDDMVTGLGGLCTTRNPFLFLLLKALEFQHVRFVSATMTPLASPKLEHAHIALLVRIGLSDYWVDIANGFPYMKPIALDKDCSEVIEHPFVNTRLVRRGTQADNAIWVVQHLFHSAEQPRCFDDSWIDNYFFAPTPVDYATGFASMHTNHYNLHANYGPFLKYLRLNMWSATAGILLRDNKLKFINGQQCLQAIKSKTLNLWDASEELSELAMEVALCGFTVDSQIIELAPEAWARCQLNQGMVRLAEVVTVTGGFFDDSADGYVGIVTVWRSTEQDNVVGLTFRTVNVYTPDVLPVVNKGFAGASWYNDELYVCWPNRIAIVRPQNGWAIVSHIDNKRFNDLHHVHAYSGGLWVANTGVDAVDHLTFDGELVSRTCISDVPRFQDDDETDLRDQKAHTALRGHDNEHVNHVAVALDGLDPNSTSSQPGKEVIAATLLNSKRVVRIQEKQTTSSIEPMVQLDATMPPHEGFTACVQHEDLGGSPLLWNSTVDGCVVASDPVSGDVVAQWSLGKYMGLPRGWTRGLCILHDGFLVGSTAIKNGADKWLAQHRSSWNFDTTKSRTAVSFIPFASPKPHEGTNSGAKSVHLLNARGAKIFSLLPIPSGVLHPTPS